MHPQVIGNQLPQPAAGAREHWGAACFGMYAARVTKTLNEYHSASLPNNVSLPQFEQLGSVICLLCAQGSGYRKGSTGVCRANEQVPLRL